MTLDEAYNRWERIERLMCEDAKRSAKKSREQTKRLKDYADAVTVYDITTATLESIPKI